MKPLITVSALIYSLLFLANYASDCSAFPDSHMGAVLQVDKTANRLTISDGETGDSITFSIQGNILWSVE